MRSCVTCFLLLITVSGSGAEPPKSPLSPEESLKHFVLADPNLQIEIVAAEPEVIDPVAIQFDEHGRLWVVELSDYPNGPEPGKPPLSRIKLLEDKDGDGRYETAHVFADKLLFATGVQPWDGGVIVTLAGEVAYFKDTDGDHKADVRETWFTGFAQANPQLRANHPTFGPDGWIYVANGLRGGDVIATKKDWPVKLPPPAGRGIGGEVPAAKGSTGLSQDPANPKPVSLTGRDFKFDPLTGRYEAISGNGQFGMTFDAWGNRFVCDNRHPCRHVIFEEDFIKRCPHVAFPAVVHDVIPADDKNQVFPLTSAWTTSNLHAGTFTAACGVTVYTGDWLPQEFRGNVFVCEPTGNLVQRAILEPDGVTFKSRNPHTDARREFLASRDDWFRPVDLQNGPDGALYVVDMYRAVIEHPEWVPDELKKRPDTWLGNDKGRIYRIRPKETQVKREPTVSVTNLDDSFNSTNGWHRMTASRVLHERVSQNDLLPIIDSRCDEASFLTLRAKQLRRFVGGAEAFRHLFSGSYQLRSEVLRLLSEFANDSDIPKTQALFGKFLSDKSPHVRFSAMQGISFAPDQDDQLTVEFAFQASEDAADPWIRQVAVAVASALPDVIFYSVVTHAPKSLEARAGRRFLLAMLGEQHGRLLGRLSDDAELDREIAMTMWELVASPVLGKHGFVNSAECALGFERGLNRSSQSLAKRDRLFLSASEKSDESLGKLALDVLSGEHKDVDQAILAARLLRLGSYEKVHSSLKHVAESTDDRMLRLAALESFASFQKPEVDAWLIDRYRSETPAIRRAILAALFASKERQLRLLEAIEQGQIAATELDPVRVNQLTQAKDETLRERAKTVLAAAAPASRHEVLDAYRPALALTADPKRGREVFVKNCSTCHRVDNVGVNVAPDISDTRTKKPEQLLMDILDPNKAIDANYFAYAVVTKEGKTESGVISSESSNSITLKQPEGKVLTLLRSDIEELRNTGLSLMPVGVEKNIDQQALADLIFWLKNWRYLDGKVPATSLGGK